MLPVGNLGAAKPLQNVPAGTVPLACSCDALLRVQARLETLATHTSERLDGLLQGLQRLPASAGFDPFAQEGAGAQKVEAAAPDEQPTSRRQQAAPLPLAPRHDARVQRTQHAAGQGSVSGAAAALGRSKPGTATVPRGRGGPGPASPPDDKLTLDRMVHNPGALASLGGEQVARLMQRYAMPAPFGNALPGTALSGGIAAALLAATATPSRSKSSLAQPFSGSPDLRSLQLGKQMPSSQSARPAASALASTPLQLGAAVAAAMDSVAKMAAPVAPSKTVPAQQLMSRLLTGGVGNALRSAIAAPQPAAAAPRAPSRLLTPTGPAPAPHTAAPQSAVNDDPDAGDAMAQRINRLLLDQAWMRGVDLK